jgi:SAM-dependent methyltransferase/uncharacterized protein YbaR (Trm112 family)
MKIRVLELVFCPHCKGDLQIEKCIKDSDDITEGILTCVRCSRRYPVIGGIPRLLPDELRGDLLLYHRKFFERFRSELTMINHGAGQDKELIVKKKTLKSFSFQWNTFGKVYKEYGQHWNNYLPNSIKNGFFNGKVGLDAGCGFGRHILQAATSGAEMVGLDLSEAVRAAHANTKHLKNVHIIQGDIYNHPFKKGVFDFIYSLGVLHHLPRPKEGFQSLAALLESGQEIFIWCYDDNKPKKNAFYEFLRKGTTKLDFHTLYIITLIMALGVKGFLNYPTKLLMRMGAERGFPYEYYLKYSFKVLHADLFDVFSVPSTRYYGLNEMQGWFNHCGIHRLESKHSISGWTVYGRK